MTKMMKRNLTGKSKGFSTMIRKKSKVRKLAEIKKEFSIYRRGTGELVSIFYGTLTNLKKQLHSGLYYTQND